MIYNQACGHCRQKLRQGLGNAYSANSANSPMNQSETRRFSTGSTTSCPHVSPPQQPWLNERVLRAFDEPPPSEPVRPHQPLPGYGVYQPGSTSFSPMDGIRNPDAAVEQVLQALGSAIEAEETTRAPQMSNPSHFPGLGAQPIPAPQPDFLSPEARAHLQLFSEPDEISTEDWWAPPPQPAVSHGPMTDFSISSPGSSVPSVPSVPSFPGSGHMSPLNPCYRCSHSHSYPDPLFTVEDEHILDSLFSRPPAPVPEPQVQPRPVPRGQQAPKKPARTFKFVLEDIGGQAPIIQ